MTKSEEFVRDFMLTFDENGYSAPDNIMYIRANAVLQELKELKQLQVVKKLNQLDFIKTELKLQGYTQKDLAIAIGKSENSISQMFNGVFNPNKTTLDKMYKFLNINIHYIITRNG